MTDDILIQAMDLVPDFPHHAEKAPKLNIRIEPQSVTCFIGPKFGGKTAYLQTLAGIHFPHSGELNILNKDVSNLTKAEWVNIHRYFAYISSDTALISSMSALQNLLLPALYHHVGSERKMEKKAREIIAELDEKMPLVKLVPYLSHEQRCKLAIARCILMEPKLVFLDEAFKGLHHLSIMDMEGFLLKRVKDFGMSLVVGTHYMEFVKANATQIVFVSRKSIEYFTSYDDLTLSKNPDVIEYLKR